MTPGSRPAPAVRRAPGEIRQDRERRQHQADPTSQRSHIGPERERAARPRARRRAPRTTPGRRDSASRPATARAPVRRRPTSPAGSASTTPARPTSKAPRRDYGQGRRRLPAELCAIGRTPSATTANSTISPHDRDPAEPAVRNCLGVPDPAEPQHAQQRRRGGPLQMQRTPGRRRRPAPTASRCSSPATIQGRFTASAPPTCAQSLPTARRGSPDHSTTVSPSTAAISPPDADVAATASATHQRAHRRPAAVADAEGGQQAPTAVPRSRPARPTARSAAARRHTGSRRTTTPQRAGQAGARRGSAAATPSPPRPRIADQHDLLQQPPRHDRRQPADQRVGRHRAGQAFAEPEVLTRARPGQARTPCRRTRRIRAAAAVPCTSTASSHRPDMRPARVLKIWRPHAHRLSIAPPRRWTLSDGWKAD